MLSCQRVAELVSEEQDRELAVRERVSLGFHLSMCCGCRNFRRQMTFLRTACRHYPAAAGPTGTESGSDPA